MTAPADGSSSDMLPLLYGELADWFHLLTHPDDYVEEAAEWSAALAGALGHAPATLLELGSGGGNNALHMKRHSRMTLTDLSPSMLALSRRINPDCEHLEGDMRTLRLGRTFDAVFLHDAVCYMTNVADLRRALETVAVHCAPDGVALVVPDEVRETWAPSSEHGGRDADPDAPDAGRALRYLEWSWDPDPSDEETVSEFAILLREPDQTVRAVRDRHCYGLFPLATWLGLLDEVGFEARPLGSQLGSYPILARRRR